MSGLAGEGDMGDWDSSTGLGLGASSLPNGGLMASVGVDPTKVLDLGEGGCCQLIT